MPAMDEVYSLQQGGGTEAEFFQAIARHGHGGGRPNTSQQGIYCFAPSGEFLAADNTRDPRRAARCLRAGLAAWKKLSRAERLGEAPPDEDPSGRWTGAHLLPDDGLVLRVWSRDLGDDKRVLGDRENLFNTDTAWFSGDEMTSLVPDARRGATRAVPERLVRRLARLHLVDNVLRQPLPFQDRSVSEASLEAKVTAVEGDAVSITYTGRTSASENGRSIELTLLGYGTWDKSKRRFVSFEIVAAGTRTGNAPGSRDNWGEGPAGIGFAFRMAGDKLQDRVPPSFFGAYGWGR